MYIYASHKGKYFASKELKSTRMGDVHIVRIDTDTWATTHGGWAHLFSSPAKGKALGLAALRAIIQMVHHHVTAVPRSRAGTAKAPRQNALAFYRMSILMDIVGCEVVHEQVSQYIRYSHSGDILEEADGSLLYCAGCNYGNTLRMTPWLRLMPTYQQLTRIGYAMRRLPLPDPSQERDPLMRTLSPMGLRQLIASPQLRTPSNTNPTYVRRHVLDVYEHVEAVPHVATYLRGLILMNDNRPWLIVDVEVGDDITLIAIPCTVAHRSLGMRHALKGVRGKEGKG